MARIVITSSADADTDRIIADLGEKAGDGVAARYEADIDKLYDRLVVHPDSGAPRPRLGRHVRICVVSPYLVIYEHFVAQDTVTIMRIVHGRRRISRKLLRGG